MRYIFGISLIALCGIVWFGYLSEHPSNDRHWTEDQQTLPHITFLDDTILIENIRNFTYTSTQTYTPHYYTKRIALRDIQSVDFIVEPFESLGAAHTFLSFGMTDGSYLAISVEIRKEVGETFSPWKGLVRQYELMYVIADERDVIDLRANHRNDSVYLYPTRATPEEAQLLFQNILNRAHTLETHPEFYNTLTNNCTTNIVAHINTLRQKPLSWDYRMLFPKDADVLAQELGFILPGMTIEDARTQFRINEQAARYRDAPAFSQKIRERATNESP